MPAASSPASICCLSRKPRAPCKGRPGLAQRSDQASRRRRDRRGNQKEAGHDMYAFLEGRIAGLPQLAGLTLLASDGRCINFSREHPVPEINVADPEVLPRLRQQPADRRFLGDPLENRANADWTVHLGRRVNTQDGILVGFVLGALDISYFENLYRSLRLGEGGGVSLWRRDGILL